MKKYLLFICLLFLSNVYAQNQSACSIASLLKVPTSPLVHETKERNCSTTLTFNDKNRKTKISENLVSVKVLHENEEVIIEREVLDSDSLCPPFCIQPIKIKEVHTVGELEVLDFIAKLKEKKARLLIDVRENKNYEQATIPGAINLPLSMFKKGSVYQTEVLKLLGGKKLKKKWIFKNPQFLLIFGKGISASNASNAIKELLKLGYPSSHLFYYRGGFDSWTSLGLTSY